MTILLYKLIHMLYKGPRSIAAWVLEGVWGVSPGFGVEHQYCACRSAKKVLKDFPRYVLLPEHRLHLYLAFPAAAATAAAPST
jgi:hypothetical protein